MSLDISNCPNCGTTLKGGIFSSIALLSENKTDIINAYHSNKSEHYCSSCGNSLYSKYKAEVENERIILGNKIQKIIEAIPIVSTHSPLNWDYKILSMVTGQSVTGTGVISEFVSTFTDFFGAQSGRFNNKLKAGEEFCFTQLRKQTLDLGGNAVIATNVGYSEVGGAKGMLMVCMSGTAIKLKNTEILSELRASEIDEVTQLNARMRLLNDLDTSEL
ncbi:MAG: heavy metal-binding domain-containing protein [Saprospiraceae bacterium]|nr:heavy metal-binding domain-containing protein [Saprospiraceae bacterium]